MTDHRSPKDGDIDPNGPTSATDGSAAPAPAGDVAPRPAAEPASRRPARPGLTDATPDIVDTKDAQTPPSQRHDATSDIVDNKDNPVRSQKGLRVREKNAALRAAGASKPELSPAALEEDDDEAPVQLRLIGPGAAAKNRRSRTGPDGDRFREIRAAHRNKVADRAKKAGRDPAKGSTDSVNGLTRSEETQANYIARGMGLVNRYVRHITPAAAALGNSGFDAPDVINPVQFAHFVLSLKPTLKPSSWRAYRQSAKAIIDTLPHDDVDRALALFDTDFNEADTPEKKSKSNDKSGRGLKRKTSALKEKKFPHPEFERALAYLTKFSKSKYSLVLADWLVAGITTGLRPIEWQATDIEVVEDEGAPNGRWVWLYVLNAKATNGRSNGLVRTIDISEFDDQTVGAIRRMSTRGLAWLNELTYDHHQSQCSQLLYQISEKIFTAPGLGRKKTYCLYSLRHQFIANMKAIKRSEEVSALVGHIVTETAHSHYAKSRTAWDEQDLIGVPDPVPEEVATVRETHKYFEQRMRDAAEAGLIRAPSPGEEEI